MLWGALTAAALHEPADLALPALYQDPEDNQLKPISELVSGVANPMAQPWHTQLGHVSVLSVEVTDEPATHDFL